MLDDPQLWYIATIMTLAMILVAALALDTAEKISCRARDLEDVRHLLTRHYRALAKFLNHEASPEELKQLLISFSDAVSDREVATTVVKDLAKATWGLESTFSKSLIGNMALDTLADLRRDHPELVDEFMRAVMTGIFAMVYRWPETVYVRDRMVAKVAISHELEIAIAARTAEIERRQGASDGGGNLAIALLGMFMKKRYGAASGY